MLSEWSVLWLISDPLKDFIFMVIKKNGSSAYAGGWWIDSYAWRSVWRSVWRTFGEHLGIISTSNQGCFPMWRKHAQKSHCSNVENTLKFAPFLHRLFLRRSEIFQGWIAGSSTSQNTHNLLRLQAKDYNAKDLNITFSNLILLSIDFCTPWLDI